MSLIIFPRGFLGQPSVSIPGEHSQFRLTDLSQSPAGDDVVKELYKAWISGSSSQDHLKFIKEASLAWQRLVPHFPSFVRTHIAMYGSHDYRVKFLIDINSFVTAGRQDMSPMSYVDLIGKPTIDTRLVKTVFAKLPDNFIGKNYEAPEFIASWLSHPMGLDNMIRTLFVLFGDQVTKGFMV